MKTDGYTLLSAEDTPALRELAAKWLHAVQAADFEALEDTHAALRGSGTPYAEITEIRWRRLQRKALELGYDGGCLMPASILERSASEIGVGFPQPPSTGGVIICLPS